MINVQNQVLTQTQMQNAERDLMKEKESLEALNERYTTILANKEASVQAEEPGDTGIHAPCGAQSVFSRKACRKDAPRHRRRPLHGIQEGVFGQLWIKMTRAL